MTFKFRNTKNITCPHCKADIKFKKDKTGRLIGTVAGSGAGFGLASSLGIAGAVLGVSVALPATLVGIGVLAFVGNRLGKEVDNYIPTCPKCKKHLVL